MIIHLADGTYHAIRQTMDVAALARSDSLRMVDDEMTLCMMRIDDIQRAINQGIIDLISILGGYTE